MHFTKNLIALSATMLIADSFAAPLAINQLTEVEKRQVGASISDALADNAAAMAAAEMQNAAKSSLQMTASGGRKTIEVRSTVSDLKTRATSEQQLLALLAQMSAYLNAKAASGGKLMERGTASSLSALNNAMKQQNAGTKAALGARDEPEEGFSDEHDPPMEDTSDVLAGGKKRDESMAGYYPPMEDTSDDLAGSEEWDSMAEHDPPTEDASEDLAKRADNNAALMALLAALNKIAQSSKSTASAGGKLMARASAASVAAQAAAAAIADQEATAAANAAIAASAAAKKISVI